MKTSSASYHFAGREANSESSKDRSFYFSGHEAKSDVEEDRSVYFTGRETKSEQILAKPVIQVGLLRRTRSLWQDYVPIKN